MTRRTLRTGDLLGKRAEAGEGPNCRHGDIDDRACPQNLTHPKREPTGVYCLPWCQSRDTVLLSDPAREKHNRPGDRF